MVLKKLKNIIDKNKAKTDERESKSLGFNTVEEYEKFKEDARQEARQEAFEINRKRKSKKIKDNIIYNRTHSPMEKMVDMAHKGKKYLDAFQKATQQPPRRKTTTTTKKKNKNKKSKTKRTKNDLESLFDF